MAGRPRKIDETLGENAPQTGENGMKSPESQKTLVVNSSTPMEIVLKSDAEGVELLFDQKELFLVLPEDVVRALNRGNRARYATARQFHDNWRGQQDVEFADAFVVDKEFVGKASTKLNDMTVRDGLVTRWARPDRVGHYAAKGYKIMSPDEAKTYLGPKGSHHEISKNGKTELVLMGVPQTIYDKRQKEKVEKNMQLGTAWKKSGIQQLESKGGRAFVESARDEKYDWKDFDQNEEN